MKKYKNKKGFTLIELIVVIAILGVLVLLAGPRLLGYTQKAELTRIQHDTKVMEQEMDQILIKDESKIASWDKNGKELGVLVMQEKLFEKEGVAKNVKRNYIVKENFSWRSLPSSENSELGIGGEEYKATYSESDENNSGDGYKIVPEDYKGKIKTKLKGTFYTNDNGKVYYEHDKPIKVDKDVEISCESPEALPDYDFDYETGTIVKWNGNAEHLVIPYSFNNPANNECVTVRIIGPGAFMKGRFQSVVIPDSVTIIGENAFKNNQLTKVNIPHSVTEVGNGAFDNNYIPAGSGSYGNSNTNFVGGKDFEQNGVAGNVTITPNYRAPSSSEAGVVFNPSTGTVVSGSSGKVSNPGNPVINSPGGVNAGGVNHPGEITIPDEINIGGVNYPVKEIAKGAYQGLGLKSVTLPSGLERIEDYAFAGNQLKGVIIPEKVSHIGNYAFAYNEKTNSKNKSKVATIKTIKIKNGAALEEQFNKLGQYGNIQSGGKKTEKVGVVQLKDFIFVTSIDNHVIDEEYGGTNPTSPADPIEPGGEAAGGIYTEEEIDALVATGKYTRVSTAEELDAVRNGMTKNHKYIQTKDIDLSGYSAGDGNGWEPIGNPSNKFKGTYDGGGFKITGLTINRPNQDYVGLFGYINGATIKNAGIKDVKATGRSGVGGLVGQNESSKVSNSYSTGAVNGNYQVGGLVGYNYNRSTVSDSYSTGNVNGNYQVGGLVGLNQTSSTVSDSYSTGSVSGTSHVGGLVGENYYESTVSNSYSTGDVNGRDSVGGLVGRNESSTISNSYYDTQTSGKTTSAGGSGKTTTEMKTKATYVGWDFDTIWQIEEGVSYPTLRQQK